jgi:hypothetical protein
VLNSVHITSSIERKQIASFKVSYISIFTNVTKSDDTDLLEDPLCGILHAGGDNVPAIQFAINGC